jgi:O-antigen ligase
MIVLISLVPARLIVPGMTDLGRPGLIVGFLLFCWWALTRCSSRLTASGPQPLRWALLFLIVTALVSYTIGFTRGLTIMESNSADRNLLFLCVFTGIALTAADGISDFSRLRSLLGVWIASATIVAAIALVQYAVGVDVSQYMMVPGLEAKSWAPGFEVRGSGLRVASTTSHYIELSAFLALTLPFAIHLACFGRNPLLRQLTLGASVLMVAGIATTISRTGILAAAIVFVALFMIWTWRMRFNILVLVSGLFVAAIAASPGLVRTLLSMFDYAASDTSIVARQERYPMVFQYVAQRPWLGRGTGTWVPPQYQILDNQWLVTLLTNGIVGVVALAGIHLTGIALAWATLRRAETRADRHFCAALISTQLIGIVVAGTFDSLGFMTYSATLALTLGLCGATWRLSREKHVNGVC